MADFLARQSQSECLVGNKNIRLCLTVFANAMCIEAWDMEDNVLTVAKNS